MVRLRGEIDGHDSEHYRICETNTGLHAAQPRRSSELGLRIVAPLPRTNNSNHFHLFFLLCTIISTPILCNEDPFAENGLF